MGIDHVLLVAVLFALIAILYSSVGHAGASGYLAVMALLSFSPASIKPTSLILNIVVASIASFKFLRAGCFDRKIFLQFALTSIPFAFLGGYLNLNPTLFKIAAGIFLILSAVIIVLKGILRPNSENIRNLPWALGASLGALIGFISGLIGVGGGIFLSPVLVFGSWADLKTISGISALFILVNSISGILGQLSIIDTLDSKILLWIATVTIGGVLGSYLGTKKFNKQIITFCLCIVLLSAGFKFLIVG